MLVPISVICMALRWGGERGLVVRELRSAEINHLGPLAFGQRSQAEPHRDFD